jgi:hypothetical protein
MHGFSGFGIRSEVPLEELADLALAGGVVGQSGLEIRWL